MLWVAGRECRAQGQQGYRGIRGHWGPVGGVTGGVGVSGVHWGLSGSVGLRASRGVGP